ncbi:hypothetical protein QFC21_007178 [Naganishia friedmannii]|uniref:Uncharacterized protein n=1 Tax=Naganishia friedmannii TaxID=89922 RepID=A0ACC2UWV0_9TREE|nr:hypothetical protein QFC21_007178 [Naganishia friedmannii]
MEPDVKMIHKTLITKELAAELAALGPTEISSDEDYDNEDNDHDRYDQEDMHDAVRNRASSSSSSGLIITPATATKTGKDSQAENRQGDDTGTVLPVPSRKRGKGSRRGKGSGHQGETGGRKRVTRQGTKDDDQRLIGSIVPAATASPQPQAEDRSRNSIRPLQTAEPSCGSSLLSQHNASGTTQDVDFSGAAAERVKNGRRRRLSASENITEGQEPFRKQLLGSGSFQLGMLDCSAGAQKKIRNT